jgi:hypothetical protein
MTASWLPAGPAPAAGEAAPRRWQPGGFDVESHSYLVVDEIVGSSIGLVLSPWPDVDSRGRLRFGGSPRMLGADRDALEPFLAEHRRPAALARPLRIGDTFAVRVIHDALADVADELVAQKRLEPLLDPEAWIQPPVYDVSADAREAAKTAFYAAVTPILTPDESAELTDLTEDKEA